MPPFSEAEARALLERTLRLSKGEGCDAQLQSVRNGNIRFARNAVSTAGTTDDVSLAVSVRYGRKVGTATINEFSDEALARVVARADELARLAPEDPEVQPLLEPQTYAAVPGAHVDATAKVDPALRADVAAKSITEAKAKGGIAAGYFVDQSRCTAIMNSKGLFGYFRDTSADYNITVRTESGGGSGWGGADANDVSRIDASSVARIAAEKAAASGEARALEPGKYTVILEPAAAVDLLQYFILNAGAREADEGQSFLTKPGGGTKLGQKLVDERVTIYSDPTHPDVPVSPWDGEWLPRGRTAWIEKGVVQNLVYSRYWAAKQGKSPVAFPGNWIMEGGDQSLEDIIRGTERGVLVTRTWYIRPVDPQTLLYTGLTRDGTFYVENGRIAYAVKNFRFNESPVIMLNNLDALGRPTRVQNAETFGRVLVPPMRIRDFTFSSLSDAV